MSIFANITGFRRKGEWLCLRRRGTSWPGLISLIMKKIVFSLAGVAMVAAFPLLIHATSDDTGSQSADGGASPAVPAEFKDEAKAAKDAFSHRKFLDAERIYNAMLSKAPGNAYILSNLGTVYCRQQKWKLAEISLSKAEAIAPQDSAPPATLGIVYFQEERYDDAINCLMRAVALDPNDADACFNLAVVYTSDAHPNKNMAILFYKRAIDLGAPPDVALDQLIVNPVPAPDF